LQIPKTVGGTGAGNGVATLTVKLPNDVKLLGSRTFLQWGVVDPAAEGLGMAFSQALRVDLVK
jgi:hypothetical protein